MADASTLACAFIALCISFSFGLNACGSWTRVPWVRMLRKDNRRYFSGGRGIARHVFFVCLWTAVSAAYSFLLAWTIQRSLQTAPKDPSPGIDSQMLLTLVVSFLICRRTRSAAPASAERQIASQFLADSARPSTVMSNSRPLVVRLSSWLAKVDIAFDVAVACLLPFYRRVWARQGIIISGSNAVLMKDYPMDQLAIAKDRFIDEKPVPQAHELAEQLKSTASLEAQLGCFCSCLYRVYGHEGARERIESYLVCERRSAARVPSSRLRHIPISFECTQHGNSASWLDASRDGRGVKLLVQSRECCRKCVPHMKRLPLTIDGSALLARTRHVTRHSGFFLWRRLALGLQIDAPTESVRNDLLLRLMRD